jgi:hypothetical protein
MRLGQLKHQCMRTANRPGFYTSTMPPGPEGSNAAPRSLPPVRVQHIANVSHFLMKMASPDVRLWLESLHEAKVCAVDPCSRCQRGREHPSSSSTRLYVRAEIVTHPPNVLFLILWDIRPRMHILAVQANLAIVHPDKIAIPASEPCLTQGVGLLRDARRVTKCAVIVLPRRRGCPAHPGVTVEVFRLWSAHFATHRHTEIVRCAAGCTDVALETPCETEDAAGSSPAERSVELPE